MCRQAFFLFSGEFFCHIVMPRGLRFMRNSAFFALELVPLPRRPSASLPSSPHGSASSADGVVRGRSPPPTKGQESLQKLHLRAPTPVSRFLQKSPEELTSRLNGPERRANKAGVTILTRTSVHCADKMVADINS